VILLISEIDIVIRILVAAFLGGLIGFEREIDGESAGIRTHVLVAVGSATFAILSFSITGDASRIVAGVVTGIGFLGAGTIFKSTDKIKGLTTAAALWCVAAVGLSCGLQYFFLATTLAIVVFFVLFIKKIKRVVIKK